MPRMAGLGSWSAVSIAASRTVTSVVCNKSRISEIWRAIAVTLLAASSVCCASANIGANITTAMMRRRINTTLRSGGWAGSLPTGAYEHVRELETRGGPDIPENPGRLPVVHWAGEAGQQHFERGAAGVPVETFKQLRGVRFGDWRVKRRQQHRERVPSQRGRGNVAHDRQRLTGVQAAGKRLGFQRILELEKALGGVEGLKFRDQSGDPV